MIPENPKDKFQAQFSKGVKKTVKMYLFYPGDEYFSINDVKIVSVAGLLRGDNHE